MYDLPSIDHINNTEYDIVYCAESLKGSLPLWIRTRVAATRDQSLNIFAAQNYSNAYCSAVNLITAKSEFYHLLKE